MSEQIREQVSAFLDGELPNSESELLLKRLTRDGELRESFGRYALIGESLRGGGIAHLKRGFAERVNRSIDGAPEVSVPAAKGVRARRWWRPFAGAAVAAGVATVAVVALQQRAVLPDRAAVNATPTAGVVLAQERAVPVSTGAVQAHEALMYTVPPAAGDAPSYVPSTRLTNYVFAHSKYSSVLGQNDVLNDLISNADAEAAAAVVESGNLRPAP